MNGDFVLDPEALDPERPDRRDVDPAAAVAAALAAARLARELALTAPVFLSWGDFLARTGEEQRREWCWAEAVHAGTLLGDADGDLRADVVAEQVDAGLEVWQVVRSARGRCAHCGSLALEQRPPTGAPPTDDWETVGRRIGVLVRDRGLPGGLGWSCRWCAEHPAARERGAVDHGGLQLL